MVESAEIELSGLQNWTVWFAKLDCPVLADMA
jgi:hypothetical protein